MKAKLSHSFSVSNRNFLSFALSVMLLAFCPFGSVAYAAGQATVNTKASQLDMSSLPAGIARQIQKSGQADVLVVLDDSDARAYAARQRKRLGLRHDDAAIVSGKAQFFRQRKDRVMKELSSTNYTLLKDYDNFPVLYMRVNAHALARLKGMSDVKSVGEDRVVRPFYTDSQTLIGIPTAWTYGSGQTGTGTSVAVLDTGIDYAASGIIPCANAGDPGCVGYEYCFATGGCTTDLSHGTNVSGIVFQTAPDTEVLALDVFYIDGYAHYSDITSALNWVMNNYTTYNIVAVNMSLGGTDGYTSPCIYDGLASEISTLRAAGIATVVASGDLGFSDALTAPACAPDAISVGAVYAGNYGAETWPVCTDATTAADQVACFSDSAPFLSMLAPGVDITGPGGLAMSGTSQAAPFVSGAVAVLKSETPGLTVDDEAARLEATGTPVTDGRNGITFPRLDLNAAVSVASPIILPKPAEYTFMAEQGGPNPAGQTIDIFNGGVGTMNWTFSPDPAQPWATGTPSTGTDAGTVTLSVDTSGFTSPGTYVANPQISAAGALNTPVTVPVSLDLVDSAYVEDFESPALTNKFPWVTGGNGSWATVSGAGHTGTYAAQSPPMSDSQSSYLQVTLNVTSPGYVYFWIKTDTEPTWDNVKFYIDGNNEGLWTGWSGATDWTFVQSEHEVTPGFHMFKWIYSKDPSVSQGQDAVWIDDIFFPPSNTLVPVPSFSPSSKDFGPVISGSGSSPFTFSVLNIGSADLAISSVALAGSNATDFLMEYDNCTGQTVAAGGSCTVDVIFSPASTGSKSAALVVYSNYPSPVSASLVGTGAVADTLTVSKNGTGTGTVISLDPPGGISCGADCSEAYADTTQVTLSASADTGSTFAGWSGCSSTSGSTCYVTMSGPASVTATFNMIPPVADFSAGPSTSGDVPLYVSFTDNSTNNPSSWLWNFGDGETSTEQNPSHNFKTPVTGTVTYTVSLTATNAGGSNTMTKTGYITVSPCANDPAMVSGIGYPDLASAYTNVSDSGTVELQAVDFNENVTLDRGVSFTLEGGYGCDYSSNPADSTIEGSLTVADGTLTVDRIIIQ
jgi:PKD repeat protein